MNKERIYTVVEHLRRLKEKGEENRFNMEIFFGVGAHREDEPGMQDLVTKIRTSSISDAHVMYEGECQTAACIAGHAVILFPKETAEYSGEGSSVLYKTTEYMQVATAILGLDYEEAAELFVAEGIRADYETRVFNNEISQLEGEGDADEEIDLLAHLTIDDAIVVLEHLLETGEVNWYITPTAKRAGLDR